MDGGINTADSAVELSHVAVADAVFVAQVGDAAVGQWANVGLLGSGSIGKLHQIRRFRRVVVHKKVIVGLGLQLVEAFFGV